MGKYSREELVKAIGNLSAEDLRAVAEHFEKMFGLAVPLPVPVQEQVEEVEKESETKEEKITAWNVELTRVGERKIAVIKVVRAVTNLDLRGAKNLVDEAEKGKPRALLEEGVSWKRAEEIKDNLEAQGAAVEIVPFQKKAGGRKIFIVKLGSNFWQRSMLTIAQEMAEILGKTYDQARQLLWQVEVEQVEDEKNPVLVAENVGEEERAEKIKSALEELGLVVKIE